MSISTPRFPFPDLSGLGWGGYRRLDTPQAHAALLHPASVESKQVSVAVARLGADGKYAEHLTPIQELSGVVASMQGQPDIFLSLNRFSTSRKTRDCVALNACFLDVDFYKLPTLVTRGRDQVLADCLEQLLLINCPAPSLIKSTGRGLAFVWLIHPVSLAEYKRWHLVQLRLGEALKKLGTDRAALDIPRVLRLHGTINRKNGASVEVYALTQPDRIDLVTLARRVLPTGPDRVQSRRLRSAPSNERRRTHDEQWQQRIWRERFGDIEALIKLRHPDEQLPAGDRDRYLFLMGVALSHTDPPELLYDKLIDIGRCYAGWDEPESRQRFSAIFARDTPYRYKTSTIEEALAITPAERQHLRTLVGDDQRRHRRREQQALRRRAKGAVPRKEYETRKAMEAQMQRMRVHGLIRRDKLTRIQCAERLGLSLSTVDRLLYTGPPPWLPPL